MTAAVIATAGYMLHSEATVPMGMFVGETLGRGCIAWYGSRVGTGV